MPYHVIYNQWRLSRKHDFVSSLVMVKFWSWSSICRFKNMFTFIGHVCMILNLPISILVVGNLNFPLVLFYIWPQIDQVLGTMVSVDKKVNVVVTSHKYNFFTVIWNDILTTFSSWYRNVWKSLFSAHFSYISMCVSIWEIFFNFFFKWFERIHENRCVWLILASSS